MERCIQFLVYVVTSVTRCQYGRVVLFSAGRCFKYKFVFLFRLLTLFRLEGIRVANYRAFRAQNVIQT